MTKIGNGVLWVAEGHCYYDPLRFCSPLLRFVRENKFHRGFTHLGTCCFLSDNMGVGHIRVVHTRQWTAYISPRMNDWNLFDRDEIWTVHYQVWTARMMPKTHVGSPFHMGVLFYTVEAFTFLFKPSLKRPTIDGLNNTKTGPHQVSPRPIDVCGGPEMNWVHLLCGGIPFLTPAIWAILLSSGPSSIHYQWQGHMCFDTSTWFAFRFSYTILFFWCNIMAGFGDFAIHFPFFVWKISHIDGKIVFI